MGMTEGKCTVCFIVNLTVRKELHHVLFDSVNVSCNMYKC